MKLSRIAGCFCLIVCLFASIASACVDHNVSVSVKGKDAGVGDIIVCVGSMVNVVAEAHCRPPQGTCAIVQYVWSESGGSGKNFSKTFSTAGTRAITVTARCAGGYSNQASLNVHVVEMVSLQSNKEVAGVGENVMFTVVMNPTNYYDNVSWSGGGSPATQSGGQTFTTSWSAPGTKTVTASYGSCNISKEVEVIEGLTVVPRNAYVGVGGTKSFAAWTYENGVATDVTSSSTFTTSNISFNGNVLTTSSVSPSEGADWVKATYNNETTDADHDCDLTVFDIEITEVTPPNNSISFTTLSGEYGIQCQADIIPDELDTNFNSLIEWEFEDDPGVTGDSGNPNDSQTGNNVTLTTTAPTASQGRDFKLNYRIQASLTIDGYTCESAWESIIQDDKDQLRQQYVDTGYSPIPARSSAALKNSSTYANPGNLNFGEVQCNGGAYCGNHAYLLDNTVSSQFQGIRNILGSAITVTSAYRCPRYNINVAGETNSKHTQGDAFDFDNGDAAQNWPVAQAAKSFGISTSKILLYPQAGGGSYKTLSWLEVNGYNATNLPSGWTTYRFGHITTN